MPTRDGHVDKFADAHIPAPKSKKQLPIFVPKQLIFYPLPILARNMAILGKYLYVVNVDFHMHPHILECAHNWHKPHIPAIPNAHNVW